MLKQKELLIIASLRKNSRQSLTDMSKATNIPISTILHKLKIHEKTIIKKHTSVVDFPQLGFNTRATIVIRAGKKDKEALKSFLINHPNINSACKTNSDYDFLIDAIFRNIKDLENFVEIMDNKFEIIEKKTYYIVDDLKREEFFSDHNSLDMVIK